MALLAKPLLFLNLSSEMLFVLDERLKFQQATPDRMLALLPDIIDGMFEKSWVHSMFKPATLPPLPSAYATFSHFAHSSIMSLSASRYVCCISWLSS
jgi:Organic solute transport protein 1